MSRHRNIQIICDLSHLSPARPKTMKRSVNLPERNTQLHERCVSTASALVKQPAQNLLSVQQQKTKEIVHKTICSKIPVMKKSKNEDECDTKQPSNQRPCQPCPPLHRPKDKTPCLKKQPPICPDKPNPIVPKPSCKICGSYEFPKIVFTQNSIIPYTNATSSFYCTPPGFEPFIDAPKLEHRLAYESTPVWKTSEGLHYLLQPMRAINKSCLEKSKQKNIPMRDAMVLINEIKQKMDWAFAGILDKVPLQKPMTHRNRTNHRMYELTLLHTNAIYKQPHQQPEFKMMELMAFPGQTDTIRPQSRERKLLFSNNTIRFISGKSRSQSEQLSQKARRRLERGYELANEEMQQKFHKSSLHRLAGSKMKTFRNQAKMADK